MYASVWVVEVQGRLTPSFKAFYQAVHGLPHRASVRIKVVSRTGKVTVLTMRVDAKHWKTSLAWMPEGGRLEAVPMDGVRSARDWRVVSEADVDRISDEMLEQCSDMDL